MARTLFILNDAPYGTERSYNALRLAGALSKREGEEVKVFLIGDAASCAKKNQRVPQGYYVARLGVDVRGPGRIPIASHAAQTSRTSSDWNEAGEFTAGDPEDLEAGANGCAVA